MQVSRVPILSNQAPEDGLLTRLGSNARRTAPLKGHGSPAVPVGLSRADCEMRAGVLSGEKRNDCENEAGHAKAANGVPWIFSRGSESGKAAEFAGSNISCNRFLR